MAETVPGNISPAAWECAPARARAALEGLWQSFLAVNRHYLDHAEALDRFDREGWAGAFGFEDVAALARALFGFRRAKTRGLLAIHRVFIVTHRLDRDTLAPFPWSKLALLADVVSEATLGEWLTRARRVSLTLLRVDVRAARTGQEPVLPRVSKAFALPAEAEGAVELALEAAGTVGATDDRGVQLSLLAAEFLATHGSGMRAVAPVALTLRLDPVDYQAVTRALDEIRSLTGAPSRAHALVWLCRWFQREARVSDGEARARSEGPGNEHSVERVPARV